MIDADAGRSDRVLIQPKATRVVPTTDYADLAARAADEASELYATSEHEQRSNRFDRAIRRARKK